MPAASITAFASRISRVADRGDDAAASPGSRAPRGRSWRDRRCGWRWRPSPPSRGSGAGSRRGSCGRTGSRRAACTAAMRGSAADQAELARLDAAPCRRRRCCRGCPRARRSSPAGSQPSCCSSSSTIVFCPSMRQGLTELSSVTPSFSRRLARQAQAGVEVAAHEQRPRAVGQRLRELAGRDLARAARTPARAGRRARRRRPSRPTCCRSRRRPPRSRLMRTARVTATVIPRSLNEPVGFWPSCFKRQVLDAGIGAHRVAPVERRVALRVRDDRARRRAAPARGSARRRSRPRDAVPDAAGGRRTAGAARRRWRRGPRRRRAARRTCTAGAASATGSASRTRRTRGPGRGAVKAGCGRRRGRSARDG